jgi:hypothetical protein
MNEHEQVLARPGSWKRTGPPPTNEEIGRRMDIPVEKVEAQDHFRDPVTGDTGGPGWRIPLGDLIEDRWVGSPWMLSSSPTFATRLRAF